MIKLLPKGRRLHFVFMRGGGDCPAGCTEWGYYYVTYDTLDRSAMLERELLHGAEWPEPIFLWDTPRRLGYATDPYPTVDSVYATLRDHRWWYRAHALRALGELLPTTTNAPAEPNEPNAIHFSALRAAVLTRRRESYRAMIGLLGDPDPEVARNALATLHTLTGRSFIAAKEWRQWLSSVR